MPDRKTRSTYEEYGINLAYPEVCPRCEQTTLVIELKEERWHCENRNCQWRNRLRLSTSHVMDAEQAAPALIRWHTVGPPEGMSYGWPHLDQYVKAVRGEWTLITGYPSHGKSHFMDAAMVNMAAKGWKFAMYSPENTPYERHVKGLAQKFLGKRFSDCDVDEIRLAQAWLKDRFFFIEPAEPTLEAVIAQFWKLSKEKKIQGVVIDPWNEVEHSIPLGMNETQYTARALIKWRRFCEAAHVHGWIIAHPAKIQAQRKAGDEAAKRPVVRLSDISGSANFENKAFFGLSIWRNPAAEGTAKHVNHVYVLKARNEDMGQVGLATLNWDPSSTGYYQNDQVGMGAAHADAVKDRLDKLGGWRKFPDVRKGRETDDMQGRLAQWKKDAGPGNRFSFKDDSGAATVQMVQGPGEVIWEARVVKAGKPATEKEWAIKEEALDWCEQQLMKEATE
jgi:hypothetical protein